MRHNNFQLFAIILYFDLKKAKQQIALFEEKKLENINQIQSFIFINSNNINNMNLFNIFLAKFKEIYLYSCYY